MIPHRKMEHEEERNKNNLWLEYLLWARPWADNFSWIFSLIFTKTLYCRYYCPHFGPLQMWLLTSYQGNQGNGEEEGEGRDLQQLLMLHPPGTPSYWECQMRWQYVKALCNMIIPVQKELHTQENQTLKFSIDTREKQNQGDLEVSERWC